MIWEHGDKMGKPKFSPEVRERAIPMVRDHCGDHASQWTCIESIAGKLVGPAPRR